MNESNYFTTHVARCSITEKHGITRNVLAPPSQGWSRWLSDQAQGSKEFGARYGVADYNYTARLPVLEPRSGKTFRRNCKHYMLGFFFSTEAIHTSLDGTTSKGI